jgi:large subunit ribosomal protein L10
LFTSIKLEVIKNTLLVKAMRLQVNDYGELPSGFDCNSAIFISEVANGPGKIIKGLRKKISKATFRCYSYINLY